MSTITDIKQAKGSKKRLHIYIDDEYTCTVDDFTAFKNKLKVGSEIDKHELEDIIAESEITSGFERAVDLISNTPKTKKQVADYLRQKGYMPKTVRAVVDKMLEYHYINDESYARMYIESNIARYGRKKLRFNLELRGIDKQIIDDALDSIEVPESAIFDMAKKYMRGREPTRENIDKLCRHLASKGFSWNDISPVIGKFRSNDDYESWD